MSLGLGADGQDQRCQGLSEAILHPSEVKNRLPIKGSPNRSTPHSLDYQLEPGEFWGGPFLRANANGIYASKLTSLGYRLPVTT